MAEVEVQLGQLMSTMIKIGHGTLDHWWDAGAEAASLDPALFAHFINYNFVHSEVRDSHAALPQIGLRGVPLGSQYNYIRQNDVAALMLLSPRVLYKSMLWGRELTSSGFPLSGGSGNLLESAGKMYLRVREANESWWDAATKSNRNPMRGLYAMFHVKPSPRAQAILFGKPTDRPRDRPYMVLKNGEIVPNGYIAGKHEYPAESVFEKIAQLKDMDPQVAAGTIINYGITLPIAVSALGHKPDDVILNALMTGMTGPQFFKSIKSLKRYGVLSNPKLKSVFDAAMERAKHDRHTTTLMAAHTAEMLDDSEADFGVMAAVKAQLSDVQEAVLSQRQTIEGDWAVFVDKSTSQTASIELGKRVGALIAHQVKGKVYLIFFDTRPLMVNVTGLTLEQIMDVTKEVMPVGNTSCGIPMTYVNATGIIIQGIVDITDGGHNRHPDLSDEYKTYCQKTGLTPSLNMLFVPGDPNLLAIELNHAGIAFNEIKFDGRSEDWNSLAGVINQLKVGQFELLEKIRATPLITLDQVFAQHAKQPV